jgi:P2 family phage major capsid protein
MEPRTAQLFNRYLEGVARRYGVNDPTRNFTVTPAIEQRLEQAIMERADYLRMINIEPVTQIKGEKIHIGVNGTIAKRTNTSAGNRRNPRDVAALTNDFYECAKTEFDISMPYARLDAWANRPDFERLLSDQVISQIARDRLMIGWRGTSRAIATDRVANPLLQDVNIGWLQKWRLENPERVVTGGATPGRIQIGGAGADYQNLDALVQHAVTLIHPALQDDPGLTVHIGRNTLNEKYFGLINQPEKPTETLALNVIMARKEIGGFPAMRVPFFPEGSILLTFPKNLSIYYQTGSRRRRLVDEPHYDRWANYESVNEDYVVEQYEGGVLIENIAFGDPDGGGVAT